jgi:hypothetical protein
MKSARGQCTPSKAKIWYVDGQQPPPLDPALLSTAKRIGNLEKEPGFHPSEADVENLVRQA